MRAIHLVRLDKPRPAVLLTREAALPAMNGITVAPITSTIRGSRTEVPVGYDQGLDHASVVNLDAIITVPADDVGRFIGYLTDPQDLALLQALLFAFDLRPPRA